jgi:CheY-like chemotaxis protein
MEEGHIILYAEDDPDDVFLVNKAFEKYQHIKIIHANNGEDALHLLASLQLTRLLPCLIILDINMPAVDGKEALKRIKQSDCLKKIPVVLFTTSSSQTDKDYAEQWGAELITKPLAYRDLEGLAEEFVKRCNFGFSSRS